MDALFSRIPASFWRFALVGIGGLFVDMAALYAAMWAVGLSPVAGKVVSFLMAATFTWWMNRRYTFGHSGKALLHEWASFLATNAFGGAVNFAVYTAMVTLLPGYFWMPALATAAGSVSGMMFNYLSSLHIVFKPKPAPVKPVAGGLPLPRSVYLLALVVCLGFGGVALCLGMDANWDLRNYHFYSGWAFAHGLVGRDLLVGQLASFYNPTLDVPYALVADRLPAPVIGFVLGMGHGLNFLALTAIAWRLSSLEDPRGRLAFATAAAMAGVLGAGGLSEVGTVFYDNVLSLGFFASILLVLRQWGQLTEGRGLGVIKAAVLAGLPVGLVFGLKQPMVIYCLGLCAAFLLADLRWQRRIGLAFWFGIGVLAGFAISGGHWGWHLWQTYGNPLFPYFNHLFKSPWALPVPYRDMMYVPKSWQDALLLPFRYSFSPRLVGEIDFRDFRILALVTLVPLAIAASLWRKPAVSFTRPGPDGWLLAAGLLVCVAWVPLFAIYRYLIPLEMLAPLLVVTALGLLPLPQAPRRWAIALLLLALMVTTLPGSWLRVPWRDEAVQIEGVAKLDHLEQTLVLMTGNEPMSFLIPAFPLETRFYRIDSTFQLPEELDSGFPKLFDEAIASNLGPVMSLHSAWAHEEAQQKLARYGLSLDQGHCRLLASPIGSGDYALCPTRRLTASRRERRG